MHGIERLIEIGPHTFPEVKECLSTLPELREHWVWEALGRRRVFPGLRIETLARMRWNQAHRKRLKNSGSFPIHLRYQSHPFYAQEAQALQARAVKIPSPRVLLFLGFPFVNIEQAKAWFPRKGQAPLPALSLWQDLLLEWWSCGLDSPILSFHWESEREEVEAQWRQAAVRSNKSIKKDAVSYITAVDKIGSLAPLETFARFYLPPTTSTGTF